jgi:hypothetical protein
MRLDHRHATRRPFLLLALAGSLLSGAASAQSFRVRAAGGNTFGGPPPSCAYDVTQAQPRLEERSCTDANADWVGVAAADRGMAYDDAYSEWHQLGGFTLGTEYHTSSFVSGSLVISGPPAQFIPVTLHLDLCYTGEAHPGDGLAFEGGGASVTFTAFLYNDQSLTGTIRQRLSLPANVQPNVPTTLFFDTRATTLVRGPFGGNLPWASSSITMHFPIGEPVFDLPAGYTVDSADLDIVNNLWGGPDLDEIPPVPYGSAKVNSQGCRPSIGSSGVPSLSDPSPFLVRAVDVINNKQGLMFYGYAPAHQPFAGGFKLVANPVIRTLPQSSGGNPPPDDCSGSYSFDMNARIQSGSDPALVAGEDFYCQYWYRDPADPQTIGLTDGLRAVVGP